MAHRKEWSKEWCSFRVRTVRLQPLDRVHSAFLYGVCGRLQFVGVTSSVGCAGCACPIAGSVTCSDHALDLKPCPCPHGTESCPVGSGS
eukprot:4767845-Amphidinium_carterae.1